MHVFLMFGVSFFVHDWGVCSWYSVLNSALAAAGVIELLRVYIVSSVCCRSSYRRCWQKLLCGVHGRVLNERAQLASLREHQQQ